MVGRSSSIRRSYKYDATRIVSLMHWMKQKYEDEFHNFTSRMRAREVSWPISGDPWEVYTDQQWEHTASWDAMRLQTLWCTVAGMCYYHPALQCLCEPRETTRASWDRLGSQQLLHVHGVDAELQVL